MVWLLKTASRGPKFDFPNGHSVSVPGYPTVSSGLFGQFIHTLHRHRV